jgi:hypothetical protein
MTKQKGSWVARFFVGPNLRYKHVKARDRISAATKIIRLYDKAQDIDVVAGTEQEARALRVGRRMWPLT